MNLNNSDPNTRRVFIDDFLKSKGLFVPKGQLTPRQIICRQAVGVWQTIQRTTARPLLLALKGPAQYNAAGTQQLLVDAFQLEFNKLFDKDEAITLLAIMHAEEMEKQISQQVNAGLVGDHTDKPE